MLHGGPGAPGEMAPVAAKLSELRGVIEHLQAADSVQGQVNELCSIIKQNATLPVALVGWSWRAWLGCFFAASHPDYIDKLVLVGCPPFEESYAREIVKTRAKRLSAADRKQFRTLIKELESDSLPDDPDGLMCELGGLIDKVDSFSPLPDAGSTTKCLFEVYKNVWREAATMRKSGELVRTVARIRCPVVAIHGDYDPHPATGVKEPLSRVLPEFLFILLERCGHRPWVERYAAPEFYRILFAEIRH